MCPVNQLLKKQQFSSLYTILMLPCSSSYNRYTHYKRKFIYTGIAELSYIYNIKCLAKHLSIYTGIYRKGYVQTVRKAFTYTHIPYIYHNTHNNIIM